MADRAARLVAEPLGHVDLAELARAEERDRVLDALVAAALRAGLDDPVVLPRGLDHPPAFAHVVADRLLDVHVLAGLAGPDRRQRVPVVRRGDRDRVDRLVVEHPADVLHELRLGRRSACSIAFLARPITFWSTSQIVVIRTSFLRLPEPLDVLHAPAAGRRSPRRAGLRSGLPACRRPPRRRARRPGPRRPGSRRAQAASAAVSWRK